ncbi:MAG: type II toxin-antitoxin system RelB/DinJ family antitoxin [Desulfovibrionaceae bacterium]|nr:type II toxin-antitoxin system RelB/DinJ family antitoxin [Desulfovibrionaceae bacterium]
MSDSGYVRVRIDPAIKREAAAVLAEMGLTISDLCRMTLTFAAREKRLPFSLEIPNEETRKAFRDVDTGKNLHAARDAEDLFRQLGI